MLIAAWLAWFFLARVPVYAVSSSARLEVNRAVHPVEAPVSGRIRATSLVLGRHVVQGEVLAELESDAEVFQLGEARARMDALSPQMARLQEELEAQVRAQQDERRGSAAALAQATARFEEAQAAALLAQEEERRAAELHRQGLLAEIELLRVQTDARMRRAAVTTLRLDFDRLASDQLTRRNDQQARIERLRREAAVLEGDLAALLATVRGLEHEAQRRLVRASVSGRIGEIAEISVGSVIGAGTRLAAIVPSGELMVIGHFAPRVALGLVRPGQPARLRLHGFPWTQYGSLRAHVSTVASEVTNGHIRVELTPSENRASRIPVQHGLPGTLEVEVGRVSPATLVLRAAGQLLSDPPVARDADSNPTAQRR